MSEDVTLVQKPVTFTALFNEVKVKGGHRYFGINFHEQTKYVSTGPLVFQLDDHIGYKDTNLSHLCHRHPFSSCYDQPWPRG